MQNLRITVNNIPFEVFINAHIPEPWAAPWELIACKGDDSPALPNGLHIRGWGFSFNGAMEKLVRNIRKTLAEHSAAA